MNEMNEWYMQMCRRLLTTARRYLTQKERVFLATKISREKPLTWAEMRYINAMTHRMPKPRSNTLGGVDAEAGR